MTIPKPLTVFIADDDEDDISFFKEAIHNTGLKIDLIVFNNGKQVCSHIQDSILLPDIIFLDLNMPVINGLECLKEIKKSDVFKSVPVIMLTTSSNPLDVDQAFNAGATLYVPKPNSIAGYITVIRYVTTLFFKGDLNQTDRSDFLFSHT